MGNFSSELSRHHTYRTAATCVVVASLAALPLSAAQLRAFDLFGIELGAPLKVPDCNEVAIPTFMCWKPAVKPLGDYIGVKAAEKREIHIYYGGKEPDLAQPIFFNADIIDGHVHGITVLTKGLKVQTSVLAQLETKFGKPSASSVETAQNVFGAKFQILHASWISSGSLVTFIGRLPDQDAGAIVAKTARVLDMERAEREKSNEGIPRL